MTQPIAIFGAGGFAREVLQVILDINASTPNHKPWEPVGFIVNAEYFNTESIHDLPILESTQWLQANPSVSIVIAIGSSALRQRIERELSETAHRDFPTLIHPRAWIGRNVRIDSGSIICAGSMITTDISIGRQVHINIGSTIGHDTNLQDYSTLNPGSNISGNVNIGCGTEIGTGSIVIPRTTIGSWSIIGAGSVITKDIPDNTTAVGAPARVIKTRPIGWQLS
jgi:sugar O-acyltransferase (sialic acid O-acetyltransferase NeuD family)